MLKKKPNQNELNSLILKINTGDFSGAEQQATALSKHYPKTAFVWKILGVAIAEQGRMTDAIEPMKKVVLLDPKDAEAHRNLATALKEAEEIKSAEIHFRKAIALNPEDFLAYYYLAKILISNNCYIEAEKNCRKAITFKYDMATAHDQLGVALLGQERFQEAEDSFNTAILLDPEMVDAHNNLGLTLHRQGKHADAHLSYRRAIKLNPNLANAYINMATNFFTQNLFAEAETLCRKGIELNPQLDLAWSNLGQVLQHQERQEEAKTLLEHAIALNPKIPETHNNLGLTYKELGMLDLAVEHFRKALELKPSMALVYSNILLMTGYHAQLSPEEAIEEAKRYGALVSAQARSRYTTWNCQLLNNTDKKIRVGFVSGDLKKHAVAFFLIGLLQHIDKNKFELIAYPTQPKEDDITALLKPHFIKWEPIYRKNDRDAAEIIHQDAPHILFDLSGHTAHNRLPMFAYKPAPIQVTWIGYPATTGMTEMDYILADHFLVPAGEEYQFVEDVWRMPEYVGCFNPIVENVPIAALPALQNGYVTFGCFNNLVKMSDEVVAVWARILHSVPDSKLYLQTRQLSEPSVLQRTYERYAEHGITPDRLILEGITARLDYFKSYNKIDIALDPFPRPGGTTTADTLWMSVPVLTMKGRDLWSRLGESLTHNVGLPNWIAEDTADYIRKASAFAEDRNYLVKLRSELRDKVMASPLFDDERFTKNFEEAMHEMIMVNEKKFIV